MMTTRPRKVSPTLGASASLIGDASDAIVPATGGFNHTFEADVASIEPDPAQARRSFDDRDIAALATTLAAEGQLQPILLRRHPEKAGCWVIVAGERRWRAARLLGWTRLLAIGHTGDADVAGLIENLQRVDLSPVDEARGIQRLIRLKGWTQEQVAEALGKPRSDVSGTLGILALPGEVLVEVLTSEHPPAKNVLVEMARVADPAAVRQLAAMTRNGTLTVKAVRALREAASRPDAASEDAAGQRWRAIRRAARIVGELADAGTELEPGGAATLRELRDGIDRLLARTRDAGLGDA